MISKRYIIFILVAVIVSPILVNSLFLFSTPITKGTIGDWISFYGSYIGAFIGGLVAFIIAKIQIDNQKANEKDSRFILQLPKLVELNLELKKVIGFLEKVHNMANGNTPEGLPIEQFVLVSFNRAPFIDKDKWQNIDRIVNVVLLNDIIKFRDFYLDFYEIITFNLNQVASRLNNIDLELRELENIRDKDERQIQKLKDLISEKMPLHNLYQSFFSDKQKLWGDMKKEDNLKMAKDLHIKFNQIIAQIEEKL